MNAYGGSAAVEAPRRRPGLLAVPLLVLLLGGAYMVIAGAANVMAGASAGWRIWGAGMVALGALALVAVLAMIRAWRSAWPVMLLALALFVVADLGFSWVREGEVRLAGSVWSMLAMGVLLLPPVRRDLRPARPAALPMTYTPVDAL